MGRRFVLSFVLPLALSLGFIAPSVQASAGQVTTTAQVATVSIPLKLSAGPQNAALENPYCSCNPCAPAAGIFHRNAVRVPNSYRLQVTMTINFSGAYPACYYSYTYQYTASDGRNITVPVRSRNRDPILVAAKFSALRDQLWGNVGVLAGCVEHVDRDVGYAFLRHMRCAVG